MFDFARNYKPQKMKQANILKHQFRKFEAEFPNEEDNVEALVEVVQKKQGISCEFCASVHLIRKYGAKKYRCAQCLRIGWVFAGTFFEKMRKAKLWHAAIWLTERKIVFNAWQLHILCKVAYSSALMVLKKIAKVIHTQMIEVADWIPSAAFMSVFCKRSKETPKGEHPIYEEIHINEAEKANSEGELQLENDAETKFPDTIGVEREIYELVSDIPIHIDQICHDLPKVPTGDILAGLTFLQMGNLIKAKGGDYYVREKKNHGPKANPRNPIESALFSFRVENLVNYIRDVFHGISRKHLQFYLALYHAQECADFIEPGKLIEACLDHDPFPYREIFEFVSAAEVSITA